MPFQLDDTTTEATTDSTTEVVNSEPTDTTLSTDIANASTTELVSTESSSTTTIRSTKRCNRKRRTFKPRNAMRTRKPSLVGGGRPNKEPRRRRLSKVTQMFRTTAI